MKYLIEAARSYGLDVIADQALKYPNVHGIIVDLNPDWLSLYAQHLRFPSEDIYVRALYDHDYSSFLYFRRNNWLAEITNEQKKYFPTLVPMDLRWYPRDWDDFHNSNNNLLIRIQLRPGSEAIEIDRSDQRMTIIQEHSAVPQFASSAARKMLRPLEGGVSIGYSNDYPGTLGGILVDEDSGKKYGLSCGHVVKHDGFVVDQPSSADNSIKGPIGKCVYSILPFPNNGQRCNIRDNTNLNDLDIALIELDQQIQANHSILNIGRIGDYSSAGLIHPDLIVEFNGRSSDYKRLVIGGIGFIQEIEDPNSGQKSCFRNLIEIKQPIMTNLMLNRPVQGGDSGAWVIHNGPSGLEWCGMIIGENRQSGYAIYSEDIISHLANQGYRLTCS